MAESKEGYLLSYPEDISSTFATLSPGESYKAQALRNVVRAPFDALSGALGAPADLAQGIGSGINLLSKATTGYEIPEVPIIGPAAKALGSDSIKRNVLSPLVETVAPKGYLNPKGGVEQVASNVAQTAGALVGFGGLPAKIAKYSPIAADLLSLFGHGVTPGKALLYAAGPEVASALTKKISGSEGLGEGVKIGTALLLPMFGTKKGIKQATDSLYESARSSIPENATIAAKNSENALEKIVKYATSGDMSTKSKEELQKLVAGVSRHFKDGNVPVEQLWALKKDLNERLYDLPNRINKDARRLVQGFNSAIKENLQDYAKVNPQFGAAFNEAESLFAGLRPLSHIKEFAESHLPGSASPGTLSFFKTAGIPYVGSTIESNVKMLRNKDVRKYYTQSLNAALNENKVQFAKSFRNLDKAIEKHNPTPGEGDYVLTFPQ